MCNNRYRRFGMKRQCCRVIRIMLVAGILCGSGNAAKPEPEVHTLGDLLEMSPSELSKVDLAEMYLLCASGLPGMEVDIAYCLEYLDQWAVAIRQHPFDGDNFKKSQVLLEIIKRDPRRLKIPLSMSVAYVSMGRRLGFPLKFASANGIPCVRWDNGNESFNVPGLREGGVLLDNAQFGIEHSGQQIEFSPRHQKPEPPGKMQVLGVQDELSIFLGMRAARFEAVGLNAEALVAFSKAHCLSPPCIDHLDGIRRVAKKITPLAGNTEPTAATENRGSATDEIVKLNRINKMNAELSDLQRQETLLLNQQAARRNSQP
jgi:hypothetical protein